MAYYSGQASSYQEILTSLVNACGNHGWTWSTNILSKNGKSITLTIPQANEVVADPGPGIVMNISNDLYRPRFGLKRLNQGSITWPMFYQIFIFSDPDEVYLVAKYSIDYYLWMAFGVSNLTEIVANGSGMWCGAHSSSRSHNAAQWGVWVDFQTQYAEYQSDFTSAMLFGGRHESAKNWAIDLKPAGSGLTSQPVANVSAVEYTVPNYQRSNNIWSQNITLIPIDVYLTMPSSKTTLLAEIKHSRYLRIDNCEPGQIITFGADKWMVFPWWRKNSASPGGGSVTHTGTMGWAIRYDGA